MPIVIMKSPAKYINRRIRKFKCSKAASIFFGRKCKMIYVKRLGGGNLTCNSNQSIFPLKEFDRNIFSFIVTKRSNKSSFAGKNFVHVANKIVHLENIRN